MERIVQSTSVRSDRLILLLPQRDMVHVCLPWSPSSGELTRGGSVSTRPLPLSAEVRLGRTLSVGESALHRVGLAARARTLHANSRASAGFTRHLLRRNPLLRARLRICWGGRVFSVGRLLHEGTIFVYLSAALGWESPCGPVCARTQRALSRLTPNLQPSTLNPNHARV